MNLEPFQKFLCLLDTKDAMELPRTKNISGDYIDLL